MDFRLEALLAPVSAEAPAGPDLSYDAEFSALTQAAQGRPEQRLGKGVRPGEDPKWEEVKQRAEALLARSKDLRVAVLWTRAAIRLYQAEGLAAGLDLITQLLSRYWDTVHPKLEPDDPEAAIVPLNLHVLADLQDGETFLRDIRDAAVVASKKHGKVTFRDVLVSAGKLPANADNTRTKAEIAQTLGAVAAEDPTTLEAAIRSGQSVAVLEAMLGEKAAQARTPSMEALKEVLNTVAPVCKAALAGPGTAANGTPAAEERAEPGQAPVASGAIRSREDAIRTLESVCKYIERAEPSNPAPLLIRRAQRLIGRDFVEIIRDLAPESLSQIEKLGGLDKKE